MFELNFIGGWRLRVSKWTTHMGFEIENNYVLEL